MTGTIQHASALGADLARPTRRVTALIGPSWGTWSVVSIHAQGVQGEADRPERVHLVIQLGRDHLFRPRHEFDLQRRLRRHRENEDDRHGHGFVPRRPLRWGVPDGAQPAGCARPTLDWCARIAGEPVVRIGRRAGTRAAARFGRASRRVLHPGPVLERRAMSDVLIMGARELGDPVAAAALVVAGDDPVHSGQPPLRPSRTVRLWRKNGRIRYKPNARRKPSSFPMKRLVPAIVGGGQK